MSQLQELNKELVEIKKNVTEKDRRAYIKDGHASKGTIVTYLKGLGTDADTAANMLAHFKACIAKRNEVLASS